MKKLGAFIINILSFAIGIYGLYQLYTSENPSKAISQMIMLSLIVSALNLLRPVVYLTVGGGDLEKKMNLPKDTTPEAAAMARKARKIFAIVICSAGFVLCSLLAVLMYYVSTTVG